MGEACWHGYVGRKAPRRFLSDKHWAEPLKWNAEAERDGIRRRVFCASMADVFEARADLHPWRERLWTLIEQTPSLDWLLLTKRPQNFSRYLPDDIGRENIWLGVTAEAKRWADKRIPLLVQEAAKFRFLSCEPLLGPLDLTKWLDQGEIDWVIAGGESGANARPTDPRWVKSLRDQCVRHGVAFHFKQWGHWAPHRPNDGKSHRQLTISEEDNVHLWRFSKSDAGRELDGRTWDQVPL